VWVSCLISFFFLFPDKNCLTLFIQSEVSFWFLPLHHIYVCFNLWEQFHLIGFTYIIMMLVMKYMHDRQSFDIKERYFLQILAQGTDYFINSTQTFYYLASSYQQLSWFNFLFICFCRWYFPHLLLFMGNLKKFRVLKILSLRQWIHMVGLGYVDVFLLFNNCKHSCSGNVF